MELMSPAPPVSWGDAQGKLEMQLLTTTEPRPLAGRVPRNGACPFRGQLTLEAGPSHPQAWGRGCQLRGYQHHLAHWAPVITTLGRIQRLPNRHALVGNRPPQRKGARERGRLLGPTCSGSDTPPPPMASLIKNQLRDHHHLTWRARALQLLSQLGRV